MNRLAHAKHMVGIKVERWEVLNGRNDDRQPQTPSQKPVLMGGYRSLALGRVLLTRRGSPCFCPGRNWKAWLGPNRNKQSGLGFCPPSNAA
jgi:hypothetical protein